MYVFSTLYMTNILSLAITMCYLMCWPSFTGIMMLIRRPADWGAPSPAMAAAPRSGPRDRGAGAIRTSDKPNSQSCWPILWDIT